MPGNQLNPWCVAIPRIPTARSVDAPAEVAHEDGHTGFIRFRFTGLVLIFSWDGLRRSFPLSTVKSNGVHRGFDCSPLLDIFPQSCFILFLRGEIRTRPMTPWFRVYPPHAAPATLCITLTKTKIIYECRFSEQVLERVFSFQQPVRLKATNNVGGENLTVQVSCLYAVCHPCCWQAVWLLSSFFSRTICFRRGMGGCA